MCLWAMALLAGILINTLSPGIWHPWFILAVSSLHFLPYPSYVCGVFEASSVRVHGLLASLLPQWSLPFVRVLRWNDDMGSHCWI